MEKLYLASIAIAKPLSYNPHTSEFIYSDKVAEGEQKINPLPKLDEYSRIKLSMKRYQSFE
jgi:hypothetical protein